MPSLTGWKKSEDKNLSSAESKIDADTPIVQTTSKKIDIPISKPDLPKDISLQQASGKKRLPKIIVITFNNEGKQDYREYTCASITMSENTQTTLEGTPTRRKDFIDLSIDAKVVGVK